MANAFGEYTPSGDGVDLKRLIATPAFLVLAAIVVGAIAYLWFTSRSAGTNAAQAGVPTSNLGPAEGPATLSTIDTSGLQSQLSNLTQQISTVNQSNQPSSGGFTAGSGNPALKGQGSIPLFGTPSGGQVTGTLPIGWKINPSGAAVREQGWGGDPNVMFYSFPVNIGGITEWVHSTDITPVGMNTGA